jgi:hypothetical protein
MKNGRMLLLVSSFVCGAAGADDYYEQMDRLKALDKRCEQARAIKLAPIRDRLVQDCLKDRHKSLPDCQHESMAYGESTTGPNRNLIRGLYYDLPECQQAAQAWKQWEESRPLIR